MGASIARQLSASGAAVASGNISSRGAGRRAGHRRLAAALVLVGVASTVCGTEPLPPPVITPNGGTVAAPQMVTITAPNLPELGGGVIPGWLTGFKIRGAGIEEVTALSNDGQRVMALRARTRTTEKMKFAGVNMSPADGQPFPLYITSLTDRGTGYPPECFCGVTDDLAWTGETTDFGMSAQGNRVFVLLTQSTHGSGMTTPILSSCRAGLDATLASQTLATLPQLAVATLATNPLLFEYQGDKVRVLVGGQPLVSAQTDGRGWVCYTGAAASGRVTAPLGATRFWVTLAGGFLAGERELILADGPQFSVRYTYDGSPVTENSPLVTGPLRLTYDVTLRARTFSLPRYASAETVAEFKMTLPYLPTASYVSPLYVAVDYAPLDGSTPTISVSGPSGTVPAGPEGDLTYPLSAAEPTLLTLHRSGLADYTQAVVWEAIDLANNPLNGRIKIVKGESLLLTTGAGQTGALRLEVLGPDGELYAYGDGTAGDRFPVPFARGGIFSACALLDEVPVGFLEVTVAEADFQGPIACEIGFRRTKDVLTPVPNTVVFTAKDPTLVEVGVKESTAGGQRLYLKPLKAGTPVLQARLGCATGRVIASQVIDEFVLGTQATQFIGVIEEFPDGSVLVQTNLEMTPKVPDLEVRLHIFVTGVTFEDSTLDKTLNTSAFTLDPDTGQYLHPYQMIAAPGIQTGPCHTIAVYQNNVQVGN